jgi:hypothetical protein
MMSALEPLVHELESEPVREVVGTAQLEH